MAEVNHRYIGKVPSEGERKRQDERAKLDGKWKRARIAAELARQKVHEAKFAQVKRELIPRELVQRQAAFLVLSLRARLLALPGQHARELLGITDEREMTHRLDSIMRGTLDTLADMPEKVTDPDWMEKVAEGESPTPKRPKRAGH
jgi:hypothetical protein